MDDKARFDKVQQEIIPKYRTLFEKCCETFPRLKQHFAESFDDEQFSSEMIKHRQLVRDALKDIESLQLTSHALHASNDSSSDAQWHPYADVPPPGHPSGWRELIKDGVMLFGRRLDLSNDEALLLMRLILSEGRLNVFDLSQVDEIWQEQLDTDDDEEQKKRKGQIRVMLSKLRSSLCREFGIPYEKKGAVITHGRTRPTAWELNWELLCEYGLANGENAQEK